MCGADRARKEQGNGRAPSIVCEHKTQKIYALRGDGTHERGVMVSMSRKPEGGALLQGERPLIGAMKMKRKNFGQPWIKHVSGKAWADSLLLYSFLM